MPMHTIAAENKTPARNLDIEALIQQLEEEPIARGKLATLLAENRQTSPPLKMTYKEFLAWTD